ncbi:MAG: signal peptidase II [Clostridia bacterium]|nr:signal peptidase II [Clostridia bacterium]
MLLYILIILFVIAADQLTKIWASSALPELTTMPLIENVLHFTYVENRGAAFGMLADHRWIFMVLSVIGIAALLFWMLTDKSLTRPMKVILAMIIGGGIGNMIDRIRLGYVVDFIDCRFIDFYVFNVADSFVTVGCILFVLVIGWNELKTMREKKAAASAENSGETHE